MARRTSSAFGPEAIHLVRPLVLSPTCRFSIEHFACPGGRDVFFRLAVRDYLRAINVVGDCATYCYRAIEGINSAFVFKIGSDRWDDMHTALGTDRTAITSTIKDYADPIRHGNW